MVAKAPHLLWREDEEGDGMNEVAHKTVWGHININVTHLESSISFYQLLGFSVFSQGIAYLGLSRHEQQPLVPDLSAALGIEGQRSARACIMQLGSGFPKLDLTELTGAQKDATNGNANLGLVRLCLGTADLSGFYESLRLQGVSFVSEPVACKDRMAEIAVCRDPDGTLIELIQIYPERWPG